MQRKRKGFSFLKLFFFFIFFLSIYLSSCFYTNNANAQESNLKQNQDQSNKELDSLEERVFHQSYSTESKEARVSRLESFLFGKQDPKESIENRLKKITTALKVPEVEQPDVKAGLKPASTEEIKAEGLGIPPPQESVDKEGIIGAINQIEIKMFNMTFNDYPFVARINALEDRLLQKNELAKNRVKPLLERVTILVDKAGIPVQKDNKARTPRSYSIDPKTGLLINDQTGEIVKDSNGQPIAVMLPQPLPQQNYGYRPSQQQNPLYQNNPYGNQFQQNPGGIPSPYDFLFNQQNNADTGSDPGY